MPRLMPQKPRTLVEVVEHNGLRLCPRRGKGSHDLYAHPEDPAKWTVIPDYDEIDDTLVRKIYKQAGKTREEYERVLRLVK